MKKIVTLTVRIEVPDHPDRDILKHALDSIQTEAAKFFHSGQIVGAGWFVERAGSHLRRNPTGSYTARRRRRDILPEDPGTLQ
jgi:hypothetical protein